jgi:hypothetical protein
MTHPFQEYLAAQVADHLTQRRVVVWYDPRAEFTPFINELRGQPADAALSDERVERITLGRQAAQLACYDGSFFAVRAAVEPLGRRRSTGPAPRLPRRRAARRPMLPLLELERGGTTYEPQLRRQARNVLRRNHSDGHCQLKSRYRAKWCAEACSAPGRCAIRPWRGCR